LGQSRGGVGVPHHDLKRKGGGGETALAFLAREKKSEGGEAEKTGTFLGFRRGLFPVEKHDRLDGGRALNGWIRNVNPQRGKGLSSLRGTRVEHPQWSKNNEQFHSHIVYPRSIIAPWGSVKN